MGRNDNYYRNERDGQRQSAMGEEFRVELVFNHVTGGFVLNC